jgi:hypothetical protein
MKKNNPTNFPRTMEVQHMPNSIDHATRYMHILVQDKKDMTYQEKSTTLLCLS